MERRSGALASFIKLGGKVGDGAGDAPRSPQTPPPGAAACGVAALLIRIFINTS